jgi:hypothetical protein
MDGNPYESSREELSRPHGKGIVVLLVILLIVLLSATFGLFTYLIEVRNAMDKL